MYTEIAETAFLQPLLSGETLQLRPLLAGDFEDLYLAASDPLIWALHPSPNRYRRDEFTAWFSLALTSGGSLVIVDQASGRIIGSSRFYEWDPEQRELAIGYTFLAREFWGGAANAELKHLMLSHAFTRVDTVWFHVAAVNLRSQAAMRKIGGRLSHSALRDVPGGPSQEYYYYRVDKS